MMDLHTYTASGSDRIRRFVLASDTPIAGPGRHRFATPEEAEAHPVAAAVLSVPGVQEVILEGNAVVVLRREDLPWDALEDRISYAIGAALGLGPGGADEAAGEPLPDDEIFARVARTLQ